MSQSPEVIWQVIRNNSCFLRKQRTGTLNSDPNNLWNKNTFRYSSLVNKKSFGLRLKKGNVILSIKTKSDNKPKKAYENVTLVKKGTKKINFRRVVKSIKNIGCRKGYRPDLTLAALARWTKIHRSMLKSKILASKKSSKKAASKKSAASTSTTAQTKLD